MTIIPRDLLDAFRDALSADVRVRRIPLETLRKAWTSALAGMGPDGALFMGRGPMAAALTSGEHAGYWVLPSTRGRCWDRSGIPALPHHIERPATAPRVIRDDAWRHEVWPGPLAWVPREALLTPQHVAVLRAVRAHLAAGTFDEPAPLKTRSLQVTGDEKRFGSLLSPTGLLRASRVPVEVWNLLPAPVPLPWHRVDQNVTTGLIVENAAPYRLLQAILRPGGPVGVLAAGNGSQVCDGVLGLAECGPITMWWYLGDLDAEGIAIAQLTAAAAAKAGGAAIAPLPGGYAAMIEAAARLLAPGGWPDLKSTGRHAHASLLPWVPPGVRDAVEGLLAAGCRIPEEVLTPADWRQLLGRLSATQGLQWE